METRLMEEKKIMLEFLLHYGELIVPKNLLNQFLNILVQLAWGLEWVRIQKYDISGDR